MVAQHLRIFWKKNQEKKGHFAMQETQGKSPLVKKNGKKNSFKSWNVPQEFGENMNFT